MGGPLDFVGDIFSNIPIVGDLITGQQNKQMMDKSWHYQTQAAQNKYQWAQQDMIKAGLNPSLMYKSANTGAGGMGVSPIPYPNLGDSMRGNISTAQDVIRTESQKNKMQQEIQESMQNIKESRSRQGLMTAQEELAYQKIMESVGMTAQAWAKTEESYSHSQKMATEKELIQQNLKTAVAEYQKILRISDVWKGPAGAFLNYVSQVREAFGVSIDVSGILAIMKVMRKRGVKIPKQ